MAIYPPLAAQQHLVAKVDARMALCERLESALNETNAARTSLVKALLNETLMNPTPARQAAE